MNIKQLVLQGIICVLFASKILALAPQAKSESTSSLILGILQYKRALISKDAQQYMQELNPTNPIDQEVIVRGQSLSLKKSYALLIQTLTTSLPAEFEEVFNPFKTEEGWQQWTNIMKELSNLEINKLVIKQDLKDSKLSMELEAFLSYSTHILLEPLITWLKSHKEKILQSSSKKHLCTLLQDLAYWAMNKGQGTRALELFEISKDLLEPTNNLALRFLAFIYEQLDWNGEYSTEFWQKLQNITPLILQKTPQEIHNKPFDIFSTTSYLGHETATLIFYEQHSSYQTLSERLLIIEALCNHHLGQTQKLKRTIQSIEKHLASLKISGHDDQVEYDKQWEANVKTLAKQQCTVLEVPFQAQLQELKADNQRRNDRYYCQYLKLLNLLSLRRNHQDHLKSLENFRTLVFNQTQLQAGSFFSKDFDTLITDEMLKLIPQWISEGHFEDSRNLLGLLSSKHLLHQVRAIEIDAYEQKSPQAFINQANNKRSKKLQKNPYFFQAWGQLLNHLGQHKEALEKIQNAIRLHQSYPYPDKHLELLALEAEYALAHTPGKHKDIFDHFWKTAGQTLQNIFGFSQKVQQQQNFREVIITVTQEIYSSPYKSPIEVAYITPILKVIDLEAQDYDDDREADKSSSQDTQEEELIEERQSQQEKAPQKSSPQADSTFQTLIQTLQSATEETIQETLATLQEQTQTLLSSKQPYQQHVFLLTLAFYQKFFINQGLDDRQQQQMLTNITIDINNLENPLPLARRPWFDQELQATQAWLQKSKLVEQSEAQFMIGKLYLLLGESLFLASKQHQNQKTSRKLRRYFYWLSKKYFRQSLKFQKNHYRARYYLARASYYLNHKETSQYQLEILRYYYGSYRAINGLSIDPLWSDICFLYARCLGSEHRSYDSLLNEAYFASAYGQFPGVDTKILERTLHNRNISNTQNWGKIPVLVVKVPKGTKKRRNKIRQSA